MTNTEFNLELGHAKSILFSSALKLTKNYQDAQDLFQDGVMRGFHHRSRFEMGTNFRAWMFTIMRNTFINNFRAKKVRRLVNEPFESFLLYTENKMSLANQSETNMRVQEIYEILDALDDKYSVPFMMHHQGYAYKEIGEYLGLPIGTVKSRLYTARQTLQKMIQAKDRVNM